MGTTLWSYPLTAAVLDWLSFSANGNLFLNKAKKGLLNFLNGKGNSQVILRVRRGVIHSSQKWTSSCYAKQTQRADTLPSRELSVPNPELCEEIIN